jgi:muramidase (phage lysozyme)
VHSKFLNKKIRSFKRRLKRKRPAVIGVTALLFLGVLSYAYYMDSVGPSVNLNSCKPLLNVIAHAESGGNYNAYFGNSTNTKIKFTDMPIADVLKWQAEYVNQGSPSSAVGRYQFLNSTLASLIQGLGINPSQRFDEQTQDRLAVALLERRGVKEYLANQLTSEQFAANLAKEWAGLPKITGDNPNASYYASDGLNKSRVEPQKVLAAIKPIAAN